MEDENGMYDGSSSSLILDSNDQIERRFYLTTPAWCRTFQRVAVSCRGSLVARQLASSAETRCYWNIDIVEVETAALYMMHARMSIQGQTPSGDETGRHFEFLHTTTTSTTMLVFDDGSSQREALVSC